MSTLDPLRWVAASPELDRVLELPPDQRAPYLESLRGRDATLAADVESLLDEHRELVAAGLLTDAPGGASGRSMEATQSWSSVDSTGAESSGPTGPTRLGPYRIVRTLGRGGMGTVYEADEIETGRRVALKILNERLNDARERERFNREGRLAASINHPHCVFVFAAVETDGRLAIAMELMQGTLADRLKREDPLPATEAVDIVLELLSGLQAAGAIGILYRDVKPSNCFVGPDGGLKIGDFGISLLHSPDGRHDALHAHPAGRNAGVRIARAASRGGARRAVRHLQPRRHALRAAHRTTSDRGQGSDVPADVRRQRHAAAAACAQAVCAEGLEPGRPAVSGEAARSAFRRLRRAGRGSCALLVDGCDSRDAGSTILRRLRGPMLSSPVLTTLVSILWLDDFVRERGVWFLLLQPGQRLPCSRRRISGSPRASGRRRQARRLRGFAWSI